MAVFLFGFVAWEEFPCLVEFNLLVIQTFVNNFLLVFSFFFRQYISMLRALY